MRVLSVIESLLHGGAETVLVDLVAGLPQHQHQVLHFSGAYGAAAHPWILTELARLGVPCFDAPREVVANVERRESAFGSMPPDIVLHHWWGTDTLRPWLDDPDAAHDETRPVFIAVLHRSGMAAPAGYDAYVLVTPTQRGQVDHIDHSRVFVIPNGVDLSRFQAGPAPATGARPFTVGRLSNLRTGKIPEDWVRTASSFGLENARFVIAGDGALRPVLEAQARALGVSDAFSFPGYVAREDVPELLATFDACCYVTSTAVECHPLALLEAAAAGVPIVAEARGGILDIVVDGESGLLAETVADVGPLLHRLQADTALRARLSNGARLSAARFSTERQAAGYADVLERLVPLRGR